MVAFGNCTSNTTTATSRPLPSGVYEPTPAFFDSTTEELDIPTTSPHMQRLVQSGVVGIVVQGSNGEAVHLSRSERDLITATTRAALDDSGRTATPIFVGCSAQSVREVLELCENAARAGGDYALICRSYFSKGVRT